MMLKAFDKNFWYSIDIEKTEWIDKHTYKDNDGYLYDSDELEKMYESYINL